jgi:serine/threonine-protein kinase
VDGRADLYALGAVAYFLLTGKAVFEAPSVVEVCGKHLFEVPIPPSERLGRVLSPDLEALVLKCLAKDRDVRPRSAAALREAFLKCEDANRYDPRTSHAWWHDRRAVLRASGSSSSWSESNPLSTLTVSRSAENSRPAKGA